MPNIHRVKTLLEPGRKLVAPMDLGDDGYRLYGRYPSSTNARGWTLIMEYKHADVISMASCVIETLMRGAQPYDAASDSMADFEDDENEPGVNPV